MGNRIQEDWKLLCFFRRAIQAGSGANAAILNELKAANPSRTRKFMVFWGWYFLMYHFLRLIQNGNLNRFVTFQR